LLTPLLRQSHAGLEVEEHRAGHTLAAKSPVVKHVESFEARIVFAAVLATAADAVLVAQHLPKPGDHLVTAQPVEERAWRQEACGTKRRGGSRRCCSK
jgi:hypothetical protein